MTDRDTNPRTPDQRTPDQQGTTGEQNDARNRANQEAARRPGVDADNALDDKGNMTATPHEGSTYQPLRMGSDEDRQRRDSADFGMDQGAENASGESHGVSRQGLPTQHGDAIRESQSAPGGGSVFQPLEADPRNLENLDDKQHGNPRGQNQQGLNEQGLNERRDETRTGDTRRP